MFKKLLSLLLITILAITAVGSVNAGCGEDYVHNIDLCVGDTITPSQIVNRPDFHSYILQYRDIVKTFERSSLFSIKYGDFDEWAIFTAIKSGEETVSWYFPFHDEIYKFTVHPMRTELDFSNIKQDANGIIKGSITLWTKDSWGNIQKTLPNQKLYIYFVKGEEHHDGVIETDNSGVAHLVDLQLCLDHAGNYNVHARFDPVGNYGQSDADTTFNSYP